MTAEFPGFSHRLPDCCGGMLAEFLVAEALGAATRPRSEWDAYDVVTPDGIRVEVKSSAYVQAWAPARPSSIRRFGGLNGRT